MENMIPHLATQARPFYELEKKILQHQIEIEAWFRNVWQSTQPLLTSSVDIRNAGFKIAAIDTNLFPAGFNNLNPDFYPLCIQAAQNTLSHYYPQCSKVLLIPENHTRNPFYYESLATLTDIIQKAGFAVRIGSMMVDKPTEIDTSNGKLTLYPLHKEGNKLLAGDFAPCLVLLNNDLSEGIPPLLTDIKQPIEPHPQLGWFYRSKAQHFTYYNEVCHTFSDLIGIDPWQLSPLFMDCGKIDFIQQEGMECLLEKTTLLFSQIQQKYHQYNIEHPPFVMVKADAGTYGMAVMPIRDPQELTHLNRKQRTTMSRRKGGQQVNRVIIQEGIYTFETVGKNNAVAEPVVYMLGHNVVGGFYRVHQGRSSDENLNAPGMHFEKLAFAECCNNPSDPKHHEHNQFYVYSVVARLALMATCKERDNMKKDQQK